MKPLYGIIISSWAAECAGLRALLEREMDLAVLGEASDAQESLSLVQRLRPDILVVDADVPALAAVRLCRQVRARFPETYVLAWARDEEDWLLASVQDAGASGLLLKSAAQSELVAAIQPSAQGKPVYTAGQLQRIRMWQQVYGEPMQALTRREWDKVQLSRKTHSQTATDS